MLEDLCNDAVFTRSLILRLFRTENAQGLKKSLKERKKTIIKKKIMLGNSEE